MVSPDVTAFVDLTLFDSDPQAVFEGALANLQSHLPEWTPREGQTEVLLLESMALMVSELAFTANRVPDAAVEVLLRLYGVDRDLGQPPTASVTFTLADIVGHIIPAGTRLSVPVTGGEPMVLSTTEDLLIAAGASEGTAPVVGDRSTADANGLAAPVQPQLLDSIVFVERVALATPVVGGAGEESDEEWFTRGVTRLSRLAETLVLPRHFQAAALEFDGVSRALAIDNYNPSAAGAAGAHPGYVTVAVYGEGGPLPDVQKTALRALLAEQAQVNLSIAVVDPILSPVNVTTAVVAEPGYAPAVVQQAVATMLQEYLNPETWAWGGVVYRNELISLIDRVEGVRRVATLTLPAADLALPGVAPLAVAGTLAITVTA